MCAREQYRPTPNNPRFFYSHICVCINSLRMDFNGWPNGARVNLPPTRAPWMDVMWTENTFFFLNCISVLDPTYLVLATKCLTCAFGGGAALGVFFFFSHGSFFASPVGLRYFLFLLFHFRQPFKTCQECSPPC